MSTIDTLKDSVKSIISTVLTEEPFFGILLKRTWIYASDKVPTAMTDGIAIYVNPQFFERLAPKEKKAVLLHELMHIVQLHPTRSKKYVAQGVPPLIINYVADAKANQYIYNYVSELGAIKPVLPRSVEDAFGVRDVEKKSFEEIMDEILNMKRHGRHGRSWGDGPIGEGPIGDGPGEGCGPVVDIPTNGDAPNSDSGRPLNEGDNGDNDKKSPEEIENRVKKKLREAGMTAKQIGRLPAELERLVEEIAKPQIHWKRLIRSTLTKGLGKSVKRTWSRPSRKIPNSYPGKETLKLGKVVVLVDTSGSIGLKELQQFVGEIWGIAREVAEVVVIPWDAEAYDPIILRSDRDIEKVKVGLKGGGGTVIYPALSLVDKRFSDAQQIVILSDWYIGDLERNETENLLKKYANRIIAVTTAKEPPSFLPVRLKIRFE
jgi:predicted metal-dependent peptidase